MYSPQLNEMYNIISTRALQSMSTAEYHLFKIDHSGMGDDKCILCM